MKVGIDISILQTPHRMRGIGFTLINFINHLPAKAKKEYSFVFFHYPISELDPTDVLNLKDVDYELREIQPKKEVNLGLPGKLNLVSRLFTKTQTFWELHTGDQRIKNLEGVDYFIQFDPNQPVPSTRKVRSALILYDLIPYILEPDYNMWSYSTARQKGVSRKRAIIFHLGRRRFKSKTKLLCKKPDQLIAISEHTKSDYAKYIGVKPAKIKVCHLGVSKRPESNDAPKEFTRYVASSWGDIPQTIQSIEKPYLLFIGGADPRRKLVDIVAAFNNLRARGYDIALIFAGDTMFGPNTVPSIDLQNYLKDNPSYTDDVYFLGFVDEGQKNYLYKNALAFVYPSVYEGFGLPVLEAMRYGVPVITYNNSSIKEIAGNAAIYADDAKDIVTAVQELLHDGGKVKSDHPRSVEQAAKYLWSDTCKNILEFIKYEE